MSSKPQPKSKIFQAVHETVVDLCSLGFIKKRKLRQFEALCLMAKPARDGVRMPRLNGNESKERPLCGF